MDDDRAAITALVYGYAERIDSGDLDGVVRSSPARSTAPSAAAVRRRRGGLGGA